MANLSTLGPLEPATSAPPASPDFSPGAPAANRLAFQNRSANLAALNETQPRLAASGPPVASDLQFVFGRDGYLTAFDADGHWWAGCSLPRRAATAMLKNLRLTGVVACLLPPPHPAAVRVALDRSEPRQAVVVLVPDERELSLMLACDDFSEEIRRHRLWFAWGPAWEEELARLFEEQPGLPMPAQFIRVPVGEPEATEPVIAAAQAVFSAAGAKRSETIRRTKDGWKPIRASSIETHRPRLCIVGGRDFRLWDDAAFTLAAVLCDAPASSTEESAGGPAECVIVCPDDPASAAPPALLSAAAGCDAVVTADTGRADLPGLLPADLPWLTWVTTPRLPAFAAAGPRDGLLLADPAWKRRAVEAGWPADRVGAARWPDLMALWPMDVEISDEHAVAPAAPHELSSPGNEAGPGRNGPAWLAHGENSVVTAQPFLGLIADCADLAPPARLDEFSSHRLLWDSVRAELESDPLLLAGSDPAAYLETRRRARDVAGENFDRQLFLEGLIFPCYVRSLARLLLRAGLPLRLFGRGWEAADEFAAHAGGAVTSRAALARAVAQSAALVHVWPAAHAHPIEAVGKAVVRPGGRGVDRFIRAARQALAGGTASPDQTTSNPRLSPIAVLEWLRESGATDVAGNMSR